MSNFADLDDELWSDVVNKIQIDENATFLEFGVASGNTMCALLNNLVKKGIRPRAVIGFDAFEGLPEEDASVAKHESWVKGAFNLKDEITNNDKIETKPSEIIDPITILVDRFKYYHKYDIDIRLIKGWYSELDSSLDINPACFIHIDCDLYISSMYALNWLAVHKLFGPNCLVRYDDWNIPDIECYTSGESLAHKEICEKYNLEFDFVDKNGHAAVLYRYKEK